MRMKLEPWQRLCLISREDLLAEVDKLRRTLDLFVGHRCTRFAAGGSAGSAMLIDFASEVQGASAEADRSILVYCSWRLDGTQQVICGAWDDNSPGGVMLTGLQKLVGKKLTSCNLESPGLDVRMLFEEDLTLRIFCDQVNEIDRADNYIVYFNEEAFVIGTKSHLRVEQNI